MSGGISMYCWENKTGIHDLNVARFFSCKQTITSRDARFYLLVYHSINRIVHYPTTSGNTAVHPRDSRADDGSSRSQTFSDGYYTSPTDAADPAEWPPPPPLPLPPPLPPPPPVIPFDDALPTPRRHHHNLRSTTRAAAARAARAANDRNGVAVSGVEEAVTAKGPRRPKRKSTVVFDRHIVFDLRVTIAESAVRDRTAGSPVEQKTALKQALNCLYDAFIATMTNLNARKVAAPESTDEDNLFCSPFCAFDCRQGFYEKAEHVPMSYLLQCLELERFELPSVCCVSSNYTVVHDNPSISVSRAWLDLEFWFITGRTPDCPGTWESEALETNVNRYKYCVLIMNHNVPIFALPDAYKADHERTVPGCGSALSFLYHTKKSSSLPRVWFDDENEQV